MATNNVINQIGTLPAFMATHNSDQTNVTGTGNAYHVLFDTESFDITSSYDVATAVFTAPLTGKYMFYTGLYIADMAATNNGISVRLKTTSQTYTLMSIDTWGGSGSQGFLSGNAVVSLTAGDTAYIEFVVGNGTNIIDVLSAASVGGVITPLFSGYILSGQ